MKHIGLFEGIGGFSLAARWMGWETVAWCEWNEFGQKVLKHHFPESEGHGDITKTDFKKYANRIDILTGGFPCQPYSAAGKRLGTADDRHLWPEMLRAISEISPRYVVGENVRGLTNWNGGLVFDQVQLDLENEGYEVLPFLLPACAVNAPHRRDRIWFVAYASSGRYGRFAETGRSNKPRAEREFLPNVGHNRNEIRGEAERRSQIVAHANERATGSPGTCRETQGDRSENNDEPKQRRGEAKLNTGCDAVLRDVANTDKQRPQAGRKLQITGDKKQPARNDTEIIIADSRSERLPFEGTNGKLGGKFGFGECNSYKDKSAWEIFPTQPPICSGNDGVSGRLDGITFPKWRNESIKAYGNAIVPQVAFQIFKAIQQMENIQ